MLVHILHLSRILLLSLVILSLDISAQDLSGKWTGRLSQQQGGIYPEYDFEMDLKQKGNQIEGISIIKVKGLFGRIKLKGSFNGKYFKFEEYEIIQEKITEDAYWCLKTGTLTLSTQNGYYYLQGLWQGHGKSVNCAPGKLWISKKIPTQITQNQPTHTIKPKDSTQNSSITKIEKQPRQTIKNEAQVKSNPPIKIKPGDDFQGRTIKEEQNALEVSSTKIIIEIWDHKEIDGDIISLFLNDQPLIERYTLKRSKHKLEIELVPGKDNFLVMHAHNLGSIIPNTAAISIQDSNQKQTRILRSDLNQSEVIRLIYQGN